MLCHIILKITERNCIMSKILVETSARHVHVTKEALKSSSERGMSSLPRKRCPSRVSTPVRKEWTWSDRRIQ